MGGFIPRVSHYEVYESQSFSWFNLNNVFDDILNSTFYYGFSYVERVGNRSAHQTEIVSHLALRN